MTDVQVVLGGSGGIGGACVRRLAADGLTVITVSRSRPGDEVMAAGDVSWVPADIATSAGRSAVLDGIKASGRSLAGLVVASGVAHRGPVGLHTGAEWRDVLEANVVGPALLVSELSREATWSEQAGVVLIGSLSARRALPDRSLYGASKAALEHFGRCIAVELAPRNIFVNILSVGVTDTPFLSGDEERLAQYVGRRVPAGRMARPEEVAAAVAFALSSGGAMIGASVEIDGGAGVLG